MNMSPVRIFQRTLNSKLISRHKVRKNLTVSEVKIKRRIQWCKNMKNLNNKWRKYFFFWWNLDTFMKTDFKCMENSGWTYRPECVGQHGRNVRMCYVLGMSDIIRSGNTSTNKEWTYELWEVYWNSW